MTTEERLENFSSSDLKEVAYEMLTQLQKAKICIVTAQADSALSYIQQVEAVISKVSNEFIEFNADDYRLRMSSKPR